MKRWWIRLDYSRHTVHIHTLCKQTCFHERTGSLLLFFYTCLDSERDNGGHGLLAWPEFSGRPWEAERKKIKHLMKIQTFFLLLKKKKKKKLPTHNPPAQSFALQKPLIWIAAIFCLGELKTMLCFSLRCLFMMTGHGAGIRAGGLLPCDYVTLLWTVT